MKKSCLRLTYCIIILLAISCLLVNSAAENEPDKIKKENQQKEKDDANFQKKLQKVNEDINRIKQLLK